MCWNGYSNQKRVAEKDIETFKVVFRSNKGKYYPYFQTNKMVYEKDACYKTNLTKEKNRDGSITIHSGFHSYSIANTIIRKNTSWCIKRFSVFTKDDMYLESYIDNGTNFEYNLGGGVTLNARPYFVRCIIPKGATYYENAQGEIVSNKIIVKEEIRRNSKEFFGHSK